MQTEEQKRERPGNKATRLLGGRVINGVLTSHFRGVQFRKCLLRHAMVEISLQSHETVILYTQSCKLPNLCCLHGA